MPLLRPAKAERKSNGVGVGGSVNGAYGVNRGNVNGISNTLDVKLYYPASRESPVIRKAVVACRGHINTTYLLTGPPSSGKSIAFPVALAREKSTFVICVQISERTARSSAAHASSTAAAGGGPSIACLGDREAISGTRPAYALTYTSAGDPTDIPTDYFAPPGRWLLFFVLDDVHVQTMGQELGYLALYRVRRAAQDNGCRNLPLKVVLATSYPHPDTLRGRFGIKDPAWAASATVSLRAPSGDDAPGADDARFSYLRHRIEKWASPAMFVACCKLKIAEILAEDPAARILLFIVSSDQAGQITADLPEGLRGKSVTADGTDFSKLEGRPGPALIIRAPDFAAAAPLRRIGHIICTQSVRARIFDNDHGQEVEKPVLLSRDELQFMRDRSSASRPRVHHMFSEEVVRDAEEGGGALFMDGDCLEYWLRALRRTEWALLRLRVLGLIKWGDGPIPTREPLLTEKGAGTLEAADKFGLNIRVAAFLAGAALEAVKRSAEAAEGASEAESGDVLLLSIVMAAATPGIVHRAAGGGPGLDDDVLAELGIRGLVEMGEGRWYGGDHWVDAAYWLSAIRKGADAPHLRGSLKSASVNARRFDSVSSKIRAMCQHYGADYQSFLRKRDDLVSDIRKFDAQGEVILAVETMFFRWMEAFRYGLIYVAADDVFAGRREGILISTGKRIGIHPAALLRLDVLAEKADSANHLGFYLVHSDLERNPDSPGGVDAKGIMSLPVALVAEFENAEPDCTLKERVAYNHNMPW
ncbi:hypothetical protein DL771_003901 [Monosporascus sp. 5C6A]|nr:hypothetical protein DL771_003901 [Monosporascus sp. 5C6A]